MVQVELATDPSFSPDIMSKFPTVKSVMDNVSVIPEFVAADYKHQPDTPDDVRAS